MEVHMNLKVINKVKHDLWQRNIGKDDKRVVHGKLQGR
jgi:hypothetical protein